MPTVGSTADGELFQVDAPLDAAKVASISAVRGFLASAELQGGDGTGNTEVDGHMEGTQTNKHPKDLAEVMDFSRYDLFTTVRLIVFSGESRRVEVQNGHLHGSMLIKEGEIYCVETDGGQGDEAFFEILSWERSSHTDVHEADPPEKNVRISTSVLLDLMKSRT